MQYDWKRGIKHWGAK